MISPSRVIADCKLEPMRMKKKKRALGVLFNHKVRIQLIKRSIILHFSPSYQGFEIDRIEINPMSISCKRLFSFIGKKKWKRKGNSNSSQFVKDH